jgi:hypothetical protein
METLLWFSLPGAILAIAVIGMDPILVQSEGSKFLAAAVVPAVGFGVHQFYRILFEVSGGFKRKSRTALDHIQSKIAPNSGIKDCKREKAFLIWETTFYSDEFPSPFRDHDRGTWHYILSFQSAAFAAALSLCWLGFSYWIRAKQSHLATIAVIEVVIGLIFALKSKTSYVSLIRQELAVTFIWCDLFTKTSEKIRDMP